MHKKGGYYFHGGIGPAKFKDLDTSRRKVTGYLSAFNNVDSDNDVIVKGAYTKSILENGPQGTGRIKYLMDHRTDKAVGVFDVLREDDFGLYYEATLGSHRLGEDYAKMVESGIIKEHSVGFSTRAWEKRDDGVTILKEIYLYEGSGLQFLGANANTPILSIKSDKDLASIIDTLESALKSGNFTDETFQTVIIPRLDALKAYAPAPEVDQDFIQRLNNLHF